MTCVYVCMCVYMHVCVYVRVCACVCACMHMYLSSQLKIQPWADV